MGSERHVCCLVYVPSRNQEDLRRTHRERDRLVKERAAHTIRIKGLLFTQGFREINLRRRRKPLAIGLADLVTGVDSPPLHLGRVNVKLPYRETAIDKPIVSRLLVITATPVGPFV